MLHPTLSMPKQIDLLTIPEAPVVYWLSDYMLKLIATMPNLGTTAKIVKGVSTSSESKFIRFHWEVSASAHRWLTYSKGGGYKKWHGLGWYCFDWEDNGARLKIFNSELFGGVHWSKSLRNIDLFDKEGIVCSRVARGSLGFRLGTEEFGFDSTSIFIKTNAIELQSEYLLCLLNSRMATFVVRSVMPAMVLESGYVGSVLLPNTIPSFYKSTVSACLTLKYHLVLNDPTERSFSNVIVDLSHLNAIATVLHTLEGFNEREVFAAYKVGGNDLQTVLDETGTPAGFHPLLAGYDALPNLPADLELPPLPQEVVEYLTTHQHIAPTSAELARIKARLRGLYEAGPGVKESEDATEGMEDGEDDSEEAAVSGAHIPIPTETFLEELSVKMQLHPISIYWLLEELHREGARCKPEELRLLEDRLSVLVLRLLGHRWPKQIEAGEAVPDWADEDGIIPLTVGAGQTTLAERLRGRLRAEDGDLGAQRAEALLHELTGLSLEDWLRREFFKRHVRQFKYRPIAWHLASDPSVAVSDAKAKKRLGGRRQPAFECLIYYHACNGDLLARIRTQYVEPLLRGARQQLGYASQAEDDTGVLQANLRIQELEEFNRRLQAVAERGFASPELDKLVTSEPLDRWSGDGYLAPADRDALLRQEQGWRVDLNDGVRVNIAPVQLAGLLASDVLKVVDAKKAIADRARWRSDERRWVREGKLPRCGWMGDHVSVSVEWTELAPQREAERAKMEEKRRAIAPPKAEQ